MKIEEKTPDYWNILAKDKETESKAIEGDTVVLIDGIAFLIQRENQCNNIVCIRVEKGSENVVRVFDAFRAFCAEKEIQYIRVEGNTHRYNMLFLVLRLAPVGVNVVKAEEESKRLNRNVFYVKTY
jgi:hypothetical protein